MNRRSPQLAAAVIVAAIASLAALTGRSPKAPPAATLVGAATVRVVSGQAPMTVNCPATAVGGCHGTIVLRAAPTTTPSSSKKRKTSGRASRCARGCRPLGQARFDAKAGKRRRVSVKLSAAGRGALARAARVKARATVITVIDGRSTTATRTVVLRSR